MCGIFGAIGRGFSLDKVKMLALLNESRGSHAVGFYNGKEIYKAAISSSKFLKDDTHKKFLHNKCDYILGHTRHATHGAAGEAKNAHPFKFESIIGMHNGVINNTYSLSKDYGVNLTVDSEYIFYLMANLSKTSSRLNDYCDVLRELEGYWGLAWVDKRANNKVYLSAYNNTVYYATENNCIYYSSDRSHLECVLKSNKNIYIVEDSTIVEIDIYKLKVQAYKVEGLRKAVVKDWSSYNSSRCYSYYDDIDDGYVYKRKVNTNTTNNTLTNRFNHTNKNILRACEWCNGYSTNTKYIPQLQMYCCPDCVEYIKEKNIIEIMGAVEKEEGEVKDKKICSNCSEEILTKEEEGMFNNHLVCKSCETHLTNHAQLSLLDIKQ